MRWYGQWNPPVDQVLFMNYLEAQPKGVFLECGAADGVGLACCKSLEEMGWKGINIEGSEEHYKKLLEIRPGSLLNIHAALSNLDGEVAFRGEVVKPGTGHSKNVRAIRLETALRMANVDLLDLLCLDIEGHEPLVLDDMMKGSIRPRVMCIEYDHCGLKAIADIVGGAYRLDGISFNNVYYSLPDVPVKNPFWGRTAECFIRDGRWVYPDKAEF